VLTAELDERPRVRPVGHAADVGDGLATPAADLVDDEVRGLR
jgi:hypothetical protein